MKTLAERLRWARGLADISARRLDQLAQLRSGHSNAIESGRRSNIEAKTAQAISRVLGVSLDWLLNGDGEPPSARKIRASVMAHEKHCL